MPPPTRQRLNGVIHDLEVFDDGAGQPPALYVCGAFRDTAPARSLALGGIARIGPNGYEPVGAANVATAYCMEPYTDASGPALWVTTDRINGARRWSAQSGWTDVPAPRALLILKTIDLNDGNGPRLYAGSRNSGDVYRKDPDGSGWTAMPGEPGLFGATKVLGLAALDPDGAGPEPARLYASTTANLKVWNGSAWTSVWATWGHALEPADDGAHGLRLYLGHHPSGSLPPDTCLSGWDGSAWFHAVGGSANWNPGYAIASIDMGPGIGPTVFSMFQGGIARSVPAGRWLLLNSVGYNSFNLHQYRGAMLAHRTVGGDVPVLVTTDAGRTGLLRYAGCPRCAADRNLDGTASVGDIFDFLEEWFADGPGDIQDLFDFLAAWFTGC